MLDFYIVISGTLLWTILLTFFIFCLQPDSNTADMRGTRRRCLVFIRASFIFFYTGYLIVKQDVYRKADPHNEDLMRYIILTFYCFDIINLPVYVKSNEISM